MSCTVFHAWLRILLICYIIGGAAQSIFECDIANECTSTNMSSSYDILCRGSAVVETVTLSMLRLILNVWEHLAATTYQFYKLYQVDGKQSTVMVCTVVL